MDFIWIAAIAAMGALMWGLIIGCDRLWVSGSRP